MTSAAAISMSGSLSCTAVCSECCATLLHGATRLASRGMNVSCWRRCRACGVITHTYTHTHMDTHTKSHSYLVTKHTKGYRRHCHFALHASIEEAQPATLRVCVRACAAHVRGLGYTLLSTLTTSYRPLRACSMSSHTVHSWSYASTSRRAPGSAPDANRSLASLPRIMARLRVSAAPV